jgi:hypothetical protein
MDKNISRWVDMDEEPVAATIIDYEQHQVGMCLRLA